MRARHWVSVLLVVMCIVGATAAPDDYPRAARVVDVYDGDTITVESTGEEYSCRLLGLDTPELSFGRLWSEIDKVEKFLPPDGRREVKQAKTVRRKPLDHFVLNTMGEGTIVDDLADVLAMNASWRLQAWIISV